MAGPGPRAYSRHIAASYCTVQYVNGLHEPFQCLMKALCGVCAIRVGLHLLIIAVSAEQLIGQPQTGVLRTSSMADSEIGGCEPMLTSQLIDELQFAFVLVCGTILQNQPSNPVSHFQCR